jgi:hypothetical protein
MLLKKGESGYFVGTTNLDDIFRARVSDKRADVGFKAADGIDISNRFEKSIGTSDRLSYNTGFRSGTTDLKDIFQAKGYLKVKFTVTSESKSEYASSDNGSIKIEFDGYSKNYYLTFTGKTAATLTSNTSHTFSGLSGRDKNNEPPGNVGGSKSYTLTIKDNSYNLSYSFTVKIGYNTQGSSVTSYSSGTWHTLF